MRPAATPPAGGLSELGDRLNRSSTVVGLRQLGQALQGGAPVQMMRPATRSTATELDPGLSYGSASGGGSAYRFMPHQSETTPLDKLANVAEMAAREVGYSAPQTYASSIGFHPVTAVARPRESNEQGRGVQAFHQQYFNPAMSMASGDASARAVMEDVGLPILNGMNGPRQIQSLHGHARSLGSVETGRDPRNYAVGSQNANLAMQSFEVVLGADEFRKQIELKPTFYLDGGGPVAHGISVEMGPIGAPEPAVIYNLSGFDTARTQEEVIRDKAAIKAHLRHSMQYPPQAIPSPAELRESFPGYSDRDLEAAGSMVSLGQTVVLGGPNPWAANAQPLPEPLGDDGNAMDTD